MSRVVRPPSEAEVWTWETEDDDMAEGDLGYGLGRRPGGIYEVQVSHLSTSRKRSDGKNFSPPPLPGKGEERSGAIFQYSRHKSLQDTYPAEPRTSHYARQSSNDSNLELSNVELKRRLQDTLEAIFGKATSHTQMMLQKTMEQKRSLEKEINALQWEIEFDQNRFKNIEESWTQKYDRLNCENAVLQETLNVKTEEIKMLKSENALLNQQYLEALAMLDVKQQMVAPENVCHDKSGFTEVSGLEVGKQLAVLGACLCHGPRGRPCDCAKMAASARGMLLKLKQELGLLQKSKEEAYIMADAFRIAFEQQLMRKNDQALRLTQMDKMYTKATKWINWKHLKEDGLPSQGSKKTLGQKLLGMLPSENSSKKTDAQNNPQEVCKMLTELLNDKEEALAHQRKVSYMLARALEERDTTSNENKEKCPVKDNFPLKNLWGKSSEFLELHDPVFSSVQILNSAGCICSIQHLHRDQNCTRTLKRSCSLPSNIIF
ncbi:coiled-coil domain-containing protein 125 isoform X4 [Leptonychotes weddellii]|uniref:Coiled-coil domain-containing protein 125 isoform X4 n=1 Tax=Leptonychotes weddellii TaxID=9713 RepID=A0A7F8R942_LEPWE|nr:coiled-coil domain-containing protein 125 isoform X4 [Leptonychotes weddellii]